jgi:hypothetical protein
MQVATGIGLLTTYVPSAGGAYESLQYITHKAPLSVLLRGMHYWGASPGAKTSGSGCRGMHLLGNCRSDSGRMA